jgi:hypothetical protein
MLATSDANVQATIRANVERIVTFSTFFDSKLAWYPNALCYVDSHAIYNPSTEATQHPDWILTDMQGNKLFIPWGCANGTCPQYAADIGNQGFRDSQVTRIKSIIAKGYVGIWLDDVNMTKSIGNGNAQTVAPKDPRTGQQMTDANWRKYLAEFVEQIRAATPGKELVHNSIWYHSRDLPNDPSIKRQILAADYIDVERGFSDGGITGGTGQWSLDALMKEIDYIHSLGRAVMIDDLDVSTELYAVACYFLIQNGKDVYGNMGRLPTQLPAYFKFNLGLATGARYKWNNLWRRDFANGMVLVNEPQAGTVTVPLPVVHFDENGNSVNSITLGAKQGKLLRKTR